MLPLPVIISCPFNLLFFRNLTEADFVNTLKVLQSMTPTSPPETYSYVAVNAFHHLISGISGPLLSQFSLENEALRQQFSNEKERLAVEFSLEKEALRQQFSNEKEALHQQFSDEKDNLYLQIKDLTVAKERLAVENE